MKKRIILTVITAFVLIIAAIGAIKTYSSNKLKRYIKSQNYQYLILKDAHSNKNEVSSTFELNLSAFENEKEFAIEVQSLKSDIEKFLENNYHDSITLIPLVNIVIANDNRFGACLRLSNNTGDTFNERGYTSNELKIDCGYIYCSGMDISSFSCIDGFKYLRLNELKGIDYASALSNIKDLQYLEIETKENLNDIDTDKIKEQHPNCKIVLIDVTK